MTSIMKWCVPPLSLSIVLIHLMNIVQEALPKLADDLTNFKSLSYLEMQYLGRCYRRLGLSDLDMDFSIVSAWGAACPTLSTCVMPSKYLPLLITRYAH